MKIVLWIIISLVVFVLTMGVGFLIFRRGMRKENPEDIIRFIEQKFASGNVSLSIKHNDQNWVEVNPDQPLPLASTVKIILAIEYAHQAAAGKINPNQTVDLQELDRFYIPNTDGGAHEAWVTHLNKANEIISVPLSEVANGMIAYSSNANTEYLMDILGLENINQMITRLGLIQHEPIYPIISALYIPTQLMNEKSLSKQETLEEMKNMDMSEYRQRAIDIHHEWLNQPPSDQVKKQLVNILSMDFQRVWSDRLPRSTTRDYLSIMEKLNRKMHFNEKVHEYLDPVMEQLMNNPNNQNWLIHAGQKGGSTAFILTMAMYATDKEGNKTEIAFFANGLSMLEQIRLSRNMNGFQLKFLKDETFRNKIKNTIFF